jgi:iron uptake system component EfeO
LNEVSASKITGEEDRYSHTDLFDFEANVDGSHAAFDAVRPALAAADAATADTISSASPTSHRAHGLRPRQADSSATRRSPTPTRPLSQKVGALAEPLASCRAVLQ